MTDPTDATFTVYAVPKDRDDDMTDGRGLPVRAATEVSWEDADDYAARNESPDNPDQYEIREDK